MDASRVGEGGCITLGKPKLIYSGILVVAEKCLYCFF